MGMYSFTDMVDIEIVDEMLLENWLENEYKRILEKHKLVDTPDMRIPNPNQSGEINTDAEYFFWVRRLRKECEHGVTPEVFESLFDDCKIIGYWYEGFCLFLRDLAEYIDGTITLNFETGDEKAQLEFEDGYVEITTAEMVYRTPKEITEFANLPKLTAKEKLARKIRRAGRSK